ncbi:hypothetical protein ETB97_010094 [Aspergillus alliaceus]|uniref:Uncharacterized protein n=1 Tax=Petromyces alliaceus TaxID=209559 RepID=A0A5N6FXA4_PETAA|nr:uncharacterized protein BDW43DRAFT_310437 [Aspergillus alliaceus]KAB8234079.1 hypothetical protein BDW43DRAFT_310437 [Aspergillus alliaceus]KAF5863463.1 hypothetical protein ETB97_010094 [Aspergillus burnettii]
MVCNIAQHFRDGALGEDVAVSDPPVALAVENGMPPYLIGIESMDMAPFSASRLPGNDTRSNCRIDETDQLYSTQPTPTLFENLTAGLGKFVLKIQANDETVTNDVLQKEACCIMCGDDDP